MQDLVKKTGKIITYTFYFIITVGIILEIVIRNFSNWIPNDFVQFLSSDFIEKIYKHRGKIKENDSAIYHYRPFEKFNWYPHIVIDENGFRNSVFNQTEANTILLGDSMLYGKNSKIDIGELLRLNGVSSLNLAIDGYAPQHYRDVYKKYVIDKAIPHKNVIVNIFVGNDFDDTMRYPWNVKPVPEGKNYYPEIINFSIGLINYYKARRVYNIELEESKHRVKLPYREIKIRYLWWPSIPFGEKWSRTKNALMDIISMAHKSRANVFFVVMPSPASVYGMSLHPEFNKYVSVHENIVKMFKNQFAMHNIEIINPMQDLAKAVEKNFLYIDESDCHFNTLGMEIFFNILKKNIPTLTKKN